MNHFKLSVLFSTLLATTSMANTGTENLYQLTNSKDARCPSVVKYSSEKKSENLFNFSAIDASIKKCNFQIKKGKSFNKKVVRYSVDSEGTTTITHSCKHLSSGGDGYSGALIWRNIDSEEKTFSADLQTLKITYTSTDWSLLQSDCTSSHFYDKDKSGYTCEYQIQN